MMKASFPWYDLPSVQWANDCLWQATGYPGELHRDLAVTDLWHDPDLLVTQACGLDLFLSDAPIEPIAAPVFDLDCEPGLYYSYIVGDRLGQVAAVNSLTSHSGWSALLSNCSPQRAVITGSHQGSLNALRERHADVAAIDAVTWHILARDAPAELNGIRIVGQSAAALAPPYVVRSGRDRGNVFQSLDGAFESALTVNARKTLYLKGIIPVKRRDYLPVLERYAAIKEMPFYG